MFKNLLQPKLAIKIFRRFKAKKKAKIAVGPEILKVLDDGFEKLNKSKSKSLLKKHLKKNVFDSLKTKCTPNGTLLDCIQSGIANEDSICGIYASEPEAYKVYQTLFDPIIAEYHGKSKNQPKSKFGDASDLEDLDPERKYISSTRFRVCRNLNKFPFHPCLNEKQYAKIEDDIESALDGLRTIIKGHYHSLLKMHWRTKLQLKQENVMFRDIDKMLYSAGGAKNYPLGRGVFYNFDKTFAIWVNEEDHMHIISLDRGADFSKIYSPLIKAVKFFDKNMDFSHDPRLGYLSFCPTNLGTGLRVSVIMKLPKLSKDQEKFNKEVSKHKLSIRSKTADGLVNITSKQSLGLTEWDVVNNTHKGVAKIIELEKELTFGKTALPKKAAHDKPKGKLPCAKVTGAKPRKARRPKRIPGRYKQPKPKPAPDEIKVKKGRHAMRTCAKASSCNKNKRDCKKASGKKGQVKKGKSSSKIAATKNQPPAKPCTKPKGPPKKQKPCEGCDSCTRPKVIRAPCKCPNCSPDI